MINVLCPLDVMHTSV
jgi:hypothetical protein